MEREPKLNSPDYTEVNILHVLPSRHFEHALELTFSSLSFPYFAFLFYQGYHLYSGFKAVIPEETMSCLVNIEKLCNVKVKQIQMDLEKKASNKTRF